MLHTNVWAVLTGKAPADNAYQIEEKQELDKDLEGSKTQVNSNPRPP